MTGIATIVDQVLGRSRIPEGARPLSDAKPGPRPGAFPERSQSATGRMLSACADGVSRSVGEIAEHAGVSQSFVRRTAPVLAETGVWHAETVRCAHGWRVQYRSVR